MNNIKLLNFTSLDKKLLKMILSWRNDPFIKQWMFTTQNIKLEDHLRFVESLKKNSSKLYFLVQQNENYIGVIDFCDITPNSAIMGVYKNPQISGIGKQLLDIIKNYAFEILEINTLYSEVFEKNTQALKLYKSFGFKVFSSKIINNKKVICLELKNENR